MKHVVNCCEKVARLSAFEATKSFFNRVLRNITELTEAIDVIMMPLQADETSNVKMQATSSSGTLDEITEANELARDALISSFMRANDPERAHTLSILHVYSMDHLLSLRGEVTNWPEDIAPPLASLARPAATLKVVKLEQSIKKKEPIVVVIVKTANRLQSRPKQREKFYDESSDVDTSHSSSTIVPRSLSERAINANAKPNLMDKW